MTAYELNVPMLRNKPPLTANQRLHWTEKAKRTKWVRGAVCIQAKAAKIPPSRRLTVQLHYAPGDNRQRDAPNLVATSKPAIDGLVDAGCVPDDTDAYVTELMPVIHPGPGDRRLWLTVEAHS
jgi:crossover junction endodeoxyribonuclease RusA